MVFKLDWGGEGQTVLLLNSRHDLDHALNLAADYETSDQRGFILQSVVPHANRTLRVVVIGPTVKAYWRIQDNPDVFGTSMADGARIDHQVPPAIGHQVITLTRRFCQQTQINLAGLDLILCASDLSSDTPQPLFLEINYFFGRTGLGGSSAFYALLQSAVDRWLTDLGLKKGRQHSTTTLGEKP
jgi:ribosomal protein S6--L-glutamate ligase